MARELNKFEIPLLTINPLLIHLSKERNHSLRRGENW
jgi:aspartyl aminopeptidase